MRLPSSFLALISLSLPAAVSALITGSAPFQLSGSAPLPLPLIVDASLPTNPVSLDATCGTLNSPLNATCQGSTFGNCCSLYGWCGSTSTYCDLSSGCQPSLGSCTTSSSSSSSSTATSSSSSSSSSTTSSSKKTTTTTTTTSKKTTSTTSSSKTTTSTSTSSSHTSTTTTSKSTTTTKTKTTTTTKSSSSSTSSKSTTTTSSSSSSSSSSTSILPTTTTSSSQPISTDGSCGGTLNITCQLSTFGNCCSLYGWCGSASTYCNLSAGCQASFGSCINDLTSSSSSSSTSLIISSTSTTSVATSSIIPSTTSVATFSVIPSTTSSSIIITSSTHTPSQTTMTPTLSTSTTSTVVSGAANPTATYTLSTDLTCGPGALTLANGSTVATQCPLSSPCCSYGGWCGSDVEYCGVVYYACQSAFGLCSDQNPNNPIPPPGSYPPITQTSGSVLHLQCVNPGDFVLGFDDGVSAYDPQLLATLAQANVIATFFINGYNWNDITQSPYNSILQQIQAAGHQVASHTFEHLDMQTLSYDQLYAQMRRNDVAITSVLGNSFAPLYVRAPFGSVNATTMNALYSWGYTVVWEAVMNNDTTHDTPSLYTDAQQLSLDLGNYTYYLNKYSSTTNGLISLNHDQLSVTSLNFTQAAITLVQGLGYRFVSLGECLSPSTPNLWYRQLPALSSAS